MGLLRLSSVVFPLLVRGEAFIASPPPLSALQRQCFTLEPATVNAAQLPHPSGREQQLRPPSLLPSTVPLHPRSTRAMRKRSSSTVLFAREGKPMGPGTQQLSRQAKLAISVLIDLIGMSSYALPGVGEATDLGWAPISSALIFYLYGNSIFAGTARMMVGPLMAPISRQMWLFPGPARPFTWFWEQGLAFVEEILPGFDVIPTATIAWFLTNSQIGQNVTNAAAGKKPDGDVSSSAPPPPKGSPFSKSNDAREAGKGAGSRKVDDGMVQSGVIDVDSED